MCDRESIDEVGGKRRKRERGPYKQYLEPGQSYVVPDSTQRSRAKKEELDIQAGHLQDLDDSDLLVREPENPGDTVRPISPEIAPLSPFSVHDGGGDLISSQSTSSSRNTEEQTIGQSEIESLLGDGGGDSEGAADCLDQMSDALMDSEQSVEEDAPLQNVRLQLEDDSSNHCLGWCSCGMCKHELEEESIGTDKQATEMGEDGEQEKSRKEQHWGERIHPALPTTRFEVFLMLFHLFIKHRLTYDLIEDILKFINVIVGSAALKTSEYIFRKLFTPKCKVTVHLYCPKCELYQGTKDKILALKEAACKCGYDYGSERLDFHSFVTISVADLLKYLFRRPNVKLVSSNHQAGVYQDLKDGELYQEKIQSEIDQGKNVLTLTFNTDGASVFNSTKGSMWPIQFMVNELDPNDRFKEQNIFLCGMWYGKKSPNMTAFLKPFRDEMCELGKHGVELCTFGGEKVRYHVYSPLCSVDSGAKPKICHMKAHNGKFGCGFCVHPNLPVENHPSNQLRYVVSDEDGNPISFPKRSHKSMIKDMLRADELDREGKLKRKKVGTSNETQDHVNGVYGISITAGMPKFDVVWGFAIDYLHTLLLGVMNAQLKFWFDSKEHTSKTHNPSSEIDIFDKYLCSIKPPQCMATASKKMSERSDWKAKELRLLALYYILPILENLQKFSRVHFEHVVKFVTSFQILLQSTITTAELMYADKLLKEFVKDYERLYGKINMTLNVHLLTHVVDVVKNWGPLWCYSNFCFESGNGRLAKLVRGTRGVTSQICEKYLSILSVNDFINDRDVRQDVLEFCNGLIGYTYPSQKKCKRFIKFSDDTTGLNDQILPIKPEEKVAFTEAGLNIEENTLTYFDRVIHKGVAYYSRAYGRSKVFDDTVVKVNTNEFTVTEKFVKLQSCRDLFVIVRFLRLSCSDQKLAPLTYRGAHDFEGPLKVINVTDIVGKCVRMNINGKNYLCDLPNRYERD